MKNYFVPHKTPGAGESKPLPVATAVITGTVRLVRFEGVVLTPSFDHQVWGQLFFTYR